MKLINNQLTNNCEHASQIIESELYVEAIS